MTVAIGATGSRKDDVRMRNFAEDIESAIGEEIEAIVIGEEPYWPRDISSRPPVVMGRILSWKEARPMLDYEYSAGFGGQECHAIEAWTAKSVYFVSTYDGSTSIDSVRRHPTAGRPGYIGG